jgi:hypothetical protein
MVASTLVLPHMAYFVIVIKFQDLSKFAIKAINLLSTGNNMMR